MGVKESRRQIIANQPHLVDATGNPISFSTNIPAKLNECKAAFSPVQEGTGDPSPQNIRSISGWTGCEVTRCGKNLFDNSVAEWVNRYNISSEGVIQVAENYRYSPHYYEVKPSTAYVASCIRPSFYMHVCFYDKNKNFISRVSSNQGGSKAIVATTTPSNCYYVRFNIPLSADTSSTQFELGSTATAYEPYSGAAYPVTFPAVGKNLFDEAYTDISTSIKYKPIYVGDSAVTLSTDNPEVLQSVANLFLLAGDVSSGASSVTNGVWANNPKTITPVGGYVTIAYRAYSGTISPTQSQTQLEKGQTPTAYEPFTNTLYGGYVDLVTGEVWATHKLFSANSSTMNNNENYPGWKNIGVRAEGAKGGRFSGAFVNVGKAYAVNVNDNLDIIYLPKENYSNMTQSDWIELAIDIQIAYELATPIHYPLTPTIIKSLKGANTIWSDMNGNLEISYWKH